MQKIPKENLVPSILKYIAYLTFGLILKICREASLRTVVAGASKDENVAVVTQDDSDFPNLSDNDDDDDGVSVIAVKEDQASVYFFESLFFCLKKSSTIVNHFLILLNGT